MVNTDGSYNAMCPCATKLEKSSSGTGTGIDIEERKTAEDRNPRTRDRASTDSGTRAAARRVFGPDGSPLYANHVALEYFGITLDQWRDCSRISFVHPDDREHYLREAENRFRQGEPQEFEVRFMRHDG
jgi:PAS domain-containing protein